MVKDCRGKWTYDEKTKGKSIAAKAGTDGKDDKDWETESEN